MKTPDEMTNTELAQALREMPSRSKRKLLDTAAERLDDRCGTWVPIDDGAWAKCSRCSEGYDCEADSDIGLEHSQVWSLFTNCYRYCPSCGARMDGGKGNDTENEA